MTPTPHELSAGVVIVQFDGHMGALYQYLYTDHRLAGASTGGLRLCPHIYTTMAAIERTIAAVTEAVAAA